MYSFQEQRTEIEAAVGGLNQREMDLQQRLSKLEGRSMDSGAQ